MTGHEHTPSDAQLTAVEERLRGLVAEHDPPPDALFVQASAALEMRDLDGELAALVADTVSEQLTALRGERAARLLTFEAPGLTLELQVSTDGDQRQLVGALESSGDWRLRLEQPDGMMELTPDVYGRFHVDNVPAGPLRLHIDGAGSRSVRTTWVVV
jgi:hypothetical protein